MSGIVWEEPPLDGRKSGENEAIAAELRKNPGRWAKIMTDVAQSQAAQVKAGRIPAYQPAGTFEAVSRNARHVDGRATKVADIYARYIGEPS